MQLLQMLKTEVMSQCRDLFPNLPRQPTNPDRCQIVVQQPGQPNWTLAFPPTAVVKDLILAHGRLNRIPLDEIWIKDQHDDLVTHEVLLSRFTILSIGRYEDLFPIDVSEPHPEPCPIPMDLDLCTQLDLPSDDVNAHPSPDVPDPDRHATSVTPVDTLQNVTDPAVKNLLDLQPSQLTAMLPPLVADLDLCASMRRPLVSAETRLQLLCKQERVWADDEMWWQLLVIAATEPRDTAFLDPLLAFAWLTSGTAELVHAWASQQPKFSRIASVVLHDGHWTPCLWVLKPSEVEVIMWEHADTDVNDLNRLHGLISHAFGLAQFGISCTRRQFGSQLCGAAAIAFLQHKTWWLVFALLSRPVAAYPMMASGKIFACPMMDFCKCHDLGAGVQVHRMSFPLLVLYCNNMGSQVMLSQLVRKLLVQSLGSDTGRPRGLTMEDVEESCKPTVSSFPAGSP